LGTSLASVYRKTKKGVTEIETRANKLVPRLRSALILVDGKRNDEDLRKLILAEPDATLKTLLDDGYIELIAVQTVRPPPPPPPSPTEAAAAAQAAAAGQRAMEELRRNAVRTLTDLVGPMAEAVAVRMEKAHNWEELRHSLQIAQDILRNTRGAAAAKEFGDRFMPPGT